MKWNNYAKFLASFPLYFMCAKVIDTYQGAIDNSGCDSFDFVRVEGFTNKLRGMAADQVRELFELPADAQVDQKALAADIEEVYPG